MIRPARSTTQTRWSPGGSIVSRQPAARRSTERPSRIESGTTPRYAARHESTWTTAIASASGSVASRTLTAAASGEPLTGANRDVEAVLRRREWAGPFWVERARRLIREVEVEDQPAA